MATTKIAKVTFKKCIQDSQDFGRDDEHMVSQVFFDLEINGHQYNNLSVNVKQPVGSSFKSTPLEITSPEGYSGSFNFKDFRREVEKYYRESFGLDQGSAIRVNGPTRIRMSNNTYTKDKLVEIEFEEGGAAW